MEEVTRIQIF